MVHIGKLDNKKDRVIFELDSIFHSNELNLIKDIDTDQFVRSRLKKLKNYNRTKKRHPDKHRNSFKKELKSYEDIYIDILKKEYKKLKNSYIDLSDDLDNIFSKKRNMVLEQGLLETLKDLGVISNIFDKELRKEIPEHPKNEHPKARNLKRKFFIHAGPTNSGKTFESIQKLMESENGMYLAPLRLLALEIFEKLNEDGVPCDLKTGEEEVNIPFSNHYSSTIEKADLNNEYDMVVIDEGQLVNDDFRGSAWFRAIIGVVSKEIHICCSVNAINIITRIINDCGDDFEIINHHRNTPLIVEKFPLKLSKDVRKGDAIIAFSRREVLRIASNLEQDGYKTAIIYGNLPPDTRRRQVELFSTGEADIVVATDSIGMGLNLPIRRVIFSQIIKFDGKEERELTSQEVKQIAGRAGRKGMFDEGFINCTGSITFLEENINKKDDSLCMATIEPLEETIINLSIGTLKDKLKFWQKFNYKVPYLKKADITQQLELIDCIPDKINRRLTDSDIYKAIYVPFDSKKEDLKNIWVDYLREVSLKKTTITAPYIDLTLSLEELEFLYKEIDLYYSLSKTFQLDMDEDWVQEVRSKISLKIHNLLMNDHTL